MSALGQSLVVTDRNEITPATVGFCALIFDHLHYSSKDFWFYLAVYDTVIELLLISRFFCALFRFLIRHKKLCFSHHGFPTVLARTYRHPTPITRAAMPISTKLPMSPKSPDCRSVNQTKVASPNINSATA